MKLSYFFEDNLQAIVGTHYKDYLCYFASMNFSDEILQGSYYSRFVAKDLTATGKYKHYLA
jgi:hypothetical protein